MRLLSVKAPVPVQFGYHCKPGRARGADLRGGVCADQQDGSAAPEKEYRIIQPPEIKGSNDKIFGRRSASTVAADLIPELVEEDRHFIAFGRSRRNVEVILKESRDKLDAAGFLSHGDSGRLQDTVADTHRWRDGRSSGR